MVNKSIPLAILCILGGTCLSSAGERKDRPERNYTPIAWQDPESLPPVFRNHCTTNWWGGTYCEDHCGAGYQFYFCNNVSFGCCHVGLGYCDWNGSLRCAPGLLPPF